MSIETPHTQYCLFPFSAGEDLRELRQHQAELLTSSRAPNTRRAYAGRWKCFVEWCRDWRFCEPLPASPEAVADWLTWASQMHRPAYKLATIQLTIAAIRSYHRESSLVDPINAEVRSILAGIVRRAARAGFRPEVAGKRNLSVEQLRRIMRGLSDSTAIHLRDSVLILTGFASALRRSELSRLNVDQVSFESNCVRLWIAHSKNDQRGCGRDVFIEPARDPLLCPVQALERWRKFRAEYFGNWRGPLFLRVSPDGELTTNRLSGASVCRIVQWHVSRTGGDPRNYGAHSLRSGMITAAHEAGANLRSIMDRSGHKSIQNVMRYIKPIADSNPLAGVL